MSKPRQFRMCMRMKSIFGFTYWTIEEKKLWGLWWKTLHEDPCEENCKKVFDKFIDGTVTKDDISKCLV